MAADEPVAPEALHSRTPMIAFTLIAAFTATLWWGLATVTSVQMTIWWLSVGLGFMFVLPLVMATAITLVCLVLIAVLSVVALLAAPFRRGGLGELNRELLGKGAGIVPGYLTALRGIRSRAVWGLVAGSGLALVLLGTRAALSL